MNTLFGYPPVRRYGSLLSLALLTLGILAAPSSMNSASTEDSGTVAAAEEQFVWPTGGKASIVRGFSPPEERWGSGHRGVDLEMAAGSPVYAAGDGTVIYAGGLAGRGVVSIEHSGGVRTTYEPVTPSITRGTTVSAGDRIGTLDPGHVPSRDVLHWGAKYDGDTYVNPLVLLRTPEIRLWK